MEILLEGSWKSILLRSILVISKSKGLSEILRDIRLDISDLQN